MITLNDAEQKLVKYIAQQRISFNRANGATATVYGERDPMEAEVDQYGAEVAFAKIFNLYPDTGYETRNDEDCYSAMGHRIDVKFTSRENGRLLVKNKNWKNPPDLFALMIGKFPCYRFVGFMDAKELLRESRLDKRLPFPAFSANQEELQGAYS